jgi:hypothetical protein
MTMIFVLMVQAEDEQEIMNLRAFTSLDSAKTDATTEIEAFDDEYREDSDPAFEVRWEKQEDGSLVCEFGQLIYTIREVKLQS